MLSGIRQHIANYPGVTVDKKSGFFSVGDVEVEMVDLPGTYSFSSYSLEEKVAKEFIVSEAPDIILNIIDSSNLKRNLYLTFQLLEIGIPVVVVLNMIDVAKRRGITIDAKKMSEILKCPVVCTSASKGEGKTEILQILKNADEIKKNYEEFKINYDELEFCIDALDLAARPKSRSENAPVSKRWLCIKALENDASALNLLKNSNTEIENLTAEQRAKFNEKTSKSIEGYFAALRYENASIVFSECVKETKKNQATLTDKIDKIILNRWLSFPILFVIIFTIYESSIVFGYKLTNYTWPLLAAIKNFVVDITPAADIAKVPLITDAAIWLINSAVALLNYLPIFFILFAMIAILEDVGYMPRMAFVLDKIFKKFGLHGQSTLPLVLGGAFVGGCAVPGVMSTKGIADDRARMATILTVPLMNCLAKVPFYTLLLGAFYTTTIVAADGSKSINTSQMSVMMFYISTVTILAALLIAKFLTSTILKTRETAPFVMELPPYHMPTFKGVVIRACERVWLYIKKVCTIVIAVAVILFALLQFPGLSNEKQEHYANEEAKALANFEAAARKSSYYASVDSRERVGQLLNFYEGYKAKKMGGGKGVDEKYEAENIQFYKFVMPKADQDAKAINSALRKLSTQRKTILREQKNDKIESSLLGMAGRALEPISKFAGFDWRINVAFLSSFAARESAVATLGSIYESGKATEASSGEEMRPEEAMRQSSGYTPLHAASIIIFMLLTPPCIATMIVVKMQTNSYAWMAFGIFFPFTLALVVSSLFFTLANSFGVGGLTAMGIYYFILLFFVIILGFIPQKRLNWSGGLRK